MGRQSGDSTMVSTSIALLQERFRQLEREREKREEKELLKLFAESDRASPSIGHEANSNRLPLQPETVLPHRPSLQDSSLSLGLNSQGRHADFRAQTIATSTNLWSSSATSPSTSRNFDNSDVDTSLHL